MTYDSLLVVDPTHNEIAVKAIRSLHLFLDCSRIFILTNRKNIPYFEQNLPELTKLYMLDEDQIIPGLTIDGIKEILRQRIDSDLRAGWYFQQFLKMSMSQYRDIQDHYLIWDSDTIMLKQMIFFQATKSW